METRFYNSGDIKEKFATLIAKLHDAGFLTEYINEIMIQSSFFDCFEKNELSKFMDASFETIAASVFNKETIFDLNSPLSSEYYWAGLAIMDVVMNYHIPLKRFLLLFPLSDVVGSFNVFHEMHPIQFCEHYLAHEKRTSLLDILKKERGIKLSKVSDLTGISISSLRAFEKNNDALFATSFTNLSNLSKLFDINVDVFKKESSFQPFNLVMLQNPQFKEILVNNLLSYFNLEGKTYKIIETFVDDKNKRLLLKKYNVLVDISNPFGVVYYSLNRMVYKYLNNNILFFIYKKTTTEFTKNSEDLFY